MVLVLNIFYTTACWAPLLSPVLGPTFFFLASAEGLIAIHPFLDERKKKCKRGWEMALL
jgi:hypothetical protein